MAIFGGDQFGGVGVDHVVGRRHHAVLHQHLDDVHGAARHAVGEVGHRDGFRDRDVARTGGTGGLRLMALVDALQMAAIAGDRAHAFVIVRQRAGDGELAAAALAFAPSWARAPWPAPACRQPSWRRFLLPLHSRRRRRRGVVGWRAARLGRLRGGARLLLRRACLASSSAALRASSSALRFSAATRSRLSCSSSAAWRSASCSAWRRASLSGTRASARAAARRAFSSSESWRSTTPRAGGRGGAWALRRLAAVDGRGGFVRRLGGRLGGRRRRGGALLLHHHRLGAAMAEALLDGGGFRLLQRQRFAGRLVSSVSLIRFFRCRGLADFHPHRRRSRSRRSRIQDQTFRQAARFDGGMYHILAPQRQAQFGAGQASRSPRDSTRARAPRRTVCACRRRRRRWPRSAAAGGFVPSSARSTLSKPSTRAPERRARPRSPSMRATSAFSARSAEIGVGRHLRLGGAGEKLLLHRASQDRASRRSTHSPRPGSLAATSGTTSPSGPATKRTRRCFGQHFARHDVSARSRIVVARSPRLRLRASSGHRCALPPSASALPRLRLLLQRLSSAIPRSSRP